MTKPSSVQTCRTLIILSGEATDQTTVVIRASNAQNLTLFFGCSQIPVLQLGSSGQFNCTQALEGNSSSSTSLKAALDGGFGLQWSANSDLCSQCVTSGGQCGYESGSSSFTCFCSDKAYASSCSATQNAFSLSLPGMSIFLIIKIYCRRRRCIASVKAVAFWKKDRDDDQNVEVFMRQYGSLAPKRQYVGAKSIDTFQG
ncbi:unnamed protein product [Camellia sinensis]